MRVDSPRTSAKEAPGSTSRPLVSVPVSEAAATSTAWTPVSVADAFAKKFESILKTDPTPSAFRSQYIQACCEVVRSIEADGSPASNRIALLESLKNCMMLSTECTDASLAQSVESVIDASIKAAKGLNSDAVADSWTSPTRPRAAVAEASRESAPAATPVTSPAEDFLKTAGQQLRILESTFDPHSATERISTAHTAAWNVIAQIAGVDARRDAITALQKAIADLKLSSRDDASALMLLEHAIDLGKLVRDDVLQKFNEEAQATPAAVANRLGQLTEQLRRGDYSYESLGEIANVINRSSASETAKSQMFCSAAKALAGTPHNRLEQDRALWAVRRLHSLMSPEISKAEFDKENCLYLSESAEKLLPHLSRLPGARENLEVWNGIVKLALNAIANAPAADQPKQLAVMQTVLLGELGQLSVSARAAALNGLTESTSLAKFSFAADMGSALRQAFA